MAFLANSPDYGRSLISTPVKSVNPERSLDGCGVPEASFDSLRTIGKRLGPGIQAKCLSRSRKVPLQSGAFTNAKKKAAGLEPAALND
jgi:hypothetical protein